MALNKLSVSEVRSITEPGRYGDGGGLYLVASALKSGAITKRWVFRYSYNGTKRDAGLGSATDVHLHDARKKAAELRAIVAAGRDPLSEKAQGFIPANGNKTFLAVATSYIAQKSAGWRSETNEKQWTRSIATYCRALHKINIADIKTDHVRLVLHPIWLEKPDMARRVRGHIEATIDYGRALGMVPADAANPARWKGHLQLVMPKQPQTRAHHPSLPYEMLPGFMKQLCAFDSAGARALEFCILTAVRSGEARGALWAEIDWDARLWRIPAKRMKAGRPHEVPLSDEAMAVLEKMHQVRHSPFIFPSYKTRLKMREMALIQVLRNMDRPVDENGVAITVHGFRATFRTWVMEATQHDRAVAEMSLAHVVGDLTERAYARGVMLEKRRELMADWAQFAMSSFKKPTLRLVS